jgi:trans-aconitate methyltransferase
MNQYGQRYDRAQQEIVRASVDLEVLRMLDLGVGAGETSRRCLEAHPAARAVCLDQSRDKLDVAAGVFWAREQSCDLAASRIDYRKGRSI